MFRFILVTVLLSIIPTFGLSQGSRNRTLQPSEILSLQEFSGNRNESYLRFKRESSDNGPLAIFIPKDADESSLLGIPGLKGVPKQITLAVIQVNNLLASLGLARTLFLMESKTLLDLVGCFAYCEGNAVCIAAAKKCNPASLDFIVCIESAGRLVQIKEEEEYLGFGAHDHAGYFGFPFLSGLPAYRSHSDGVYTFPSQSDFVGLSGFPTFPQSGYPGASFPASYAFPGYPENSEFPTFPSPPGYSNYPAQSSYYSGIPLLPTVPQYTNLYNPFNVNNNPLQKFIGTPPIHVQQPQIPSQYSNYYSQISGQNSHPVKIPDRSNPETPILKTPEHATHPIETAIPVNHIPNIVKPINPLTYPIEAKPIPHSPDKSVSNPHQIRPSIMDLVPNFPLQNY